MSARALALALRSAAAKASTSSRDTPEAPNLSRQIGRGSGWSLGAHGLCWPGMQGRKSHWSHENTPFAPINGHEAIERGRKGPCVSPIFGSDVHQLCQHPRLEALVGRGVPKESGLHECLHAGRSLAHQHSVLELEVRCDVGHPSHTRRDSPSGLTLPTFESRWVLCHAGSPAHVRMGRGARALRHSSRAYVRSTARVVLISLGCKVYPNHTSGIDASCPDGSRGPLSP